MTGSDAHRMFDSLARAELAVADPRVAAVAGVMDDWLRRVHGVTSSSHDAGLLLDLLADEGYAVVEKGSEEHVIDFREDGWTIKHPLRCRPNLFDCPINRECEAQSWLEPPVPPGRYELELSDGDELVIGRAIEEGDRG